MTEQKDLFLKKTHIFFEIIVILGAGGIFRG